MIAVVAVDCLHRVGLRHFDKIHSLVGSGHIVAVVDVGDVVVAVIPVSVTVPVPVPVPVMMVAVMIDTAGGGDAVVVAVETCLVKRQNS